MWYGTAVLPVGYEGATWDSMVNPLHPEHELVGVEDWLYVMSKPERTRPTRVLVSSGDIGWKLGDVHALYHDQTGASLGTYTVVGISHPGGEDGEVPDRKIALAVFK